MLVRTDPFRDLDRLTQPITRPAGTQARPTTMPLDAWREGDEFFIELDLPGVDPGTLSVDVERSVLTVTAERTVRAQDADLLLAERPRGVFSRQLVLGDALDTERVAAHYDAGVLTLRIPLADRAKPRRVQVEVSGARGMEV